MWGAFFQIAEKKPSRSVQYRYKPLVAATVVAFLLLAVDHRETAAAQEDPGGRIVLDIPIRRGGSPEDSSETVRIVVRGMMKSRSGAT